MEKFVITIDTLDKNGAPDNGKVDLEFAVEKEPLPANPIARLKLSQVGTNNVFEFRFTWDGANELQQMINWTLGANPKPPKTKDPN